tara:strand:- start:176 stop:1099 length:924 start_codon:yes stop_codon:yes gene_type:complete
MKKILIVGLGPMGIAHLKSFQNKSSKYQIFLSDLNMRKIAKQNFTFFSKFKNITMNNYLPKNFIFDLVIISTNSKGRYRVIKEIVKNNKIKHLLLEKFLFPNLKDFNSFKKLIKKEKIKHIFVNTWGNYLVKKLNLINLLKKKKDIKIVIHINQGDMLTNLIHYFDIIFSIFPEKKIYLFNQDVEVIKSKRKGYDELKGELIFKLGFNFILIESKLIKKFNKMQITGDNLNYLLEIDNQGFCNLYNKKKMIKKIPFPFASKKTELWFNNFLIGKKEEKFSKNFKKVFDLSIQILGFLKKIKKKIIIT